MNELDHESKAYSRWLNVILENHANQLWNAVDDNEEDEQLNGVWENLPDRLRSRLWGLSADLFSLVDNEKFADADWEPITDQELANLLTKTFQDRQWDDLLELLRRPPRYIPSDQVAYIRGRAWQELGEHQVALKFFDNASRLKPGHAPYRILALECLKASGAWQEAIDRANPWILDPRSQASLLFRAGDVFHAYSMVGGADEQEIALRAVEFVDKGFDKLKLPGAESPLDSTLVAAYFTKAFCLERLDRIDEALKAYDAAIQRFPSNPELFTARGLFCLEHGMKDPIANFRDAVKWSAQSIWPYLELARDDYSQQNYDKTIEFCRQGIFVATRDSDKALLWDLRALALFKLDKDPVAIKNAFQTASSLDPFNLAIRHNYERFLKAIQHPDQPVGDDWETNVLPIEEVKRMVYQSVQPHFPQAA